ncbi:hypothetical protein CCM_05969 [Cordyceps militaris CM01]|uniref:Uncharacterized protein n=1 Tax=Cordyceps militaris (strain CM01) TaxID=983644 RepID=G3JI09_CORMM|nr:uncharacterized protein CCM_05969 [Cordyceps militaris CM01]EGX91812.1 hypothetical protein CCM_05969 [Cordyceps militaris CM01]
MMLPSALEVEQRWMRREIARLRELLRIDNLAYSKHHCEFTKAIQSRLRSFDHDDCIHSALLHSTVPESTNSASLYTINPRKAIITATRVVFKDPSHSGGIEYEYSMHGIVCLDQLEKHRLVLVNTVRREMGAAMDVAQLSLLHELHNTATLHYGLFHMGFRAASLDPGLQTPKEQILAKLNALFPPIAAANLDTILPLAPYSEGLRESIRFSVYEHLMCGHANDVTKWLALQTRLFSWCNMPGYTEARNALLRYTEEFKKLELLCLSTLHALECRRRSICVPESPAESSFLTSSSRSSAAPSPSPSFLDSDRSDFEPVIQDSHRSLASGRSLSSSLRYNAQLSPLLKGMPGREISAAKTDGAAFAGEIDVPPILTYPNDLSRHEFDQHPLAKQLDISLREKIQLGLIIPRQLSSQEQKTSVWQEGLRHAAAARAASALDPRGAPSELDIKQLWKNHTAAQSAPDAAELTKTPRKLKISFRRGTKSIISSPELQPDHDTPLHFELANTDLPFSTSAQNAPTSRRQSIVGPYETGYPGVNKLEKGPVQWKVAPPRLSPMEFARSHLIQAALERRLNKTPSSRLTKLWFWTPGWETFLVLPSKQMPSNKTPAQGVWHENTPSLGFKIKTTEVTLTEPQDTLQVETDRRSFLSCPRLSLNLGSFAMQFPSMLNLMTLDGIHTLISLSSSTKSGSPPDTGENRRPSGRSGIYAQQADTERTLSTLSRDSPNQRAKPGIFPASPTKFCWRTHLTKPTLDLSSASPAVHDIDRHRFQDGHGEAHTAMPIADNPFQDTSPYYHHVVSTTEASSSAEASWGFTDVDSHPHVTAAPKHIGLALPPSPPPRHSSAIARRRLRHHLAHEAQVVTPVAARKLGVLVAGGACSSVLSLRAAAAHSEDFALPDAADEERALHPPPLHVPRRRPFPQSTGRGLRERDTTRRNLFRSSSDDADDAWRGLLRHLGDGLLPLPDEDRPAPWSPLRRRGSDSLPATPSPRRQSSVLSHLSITPTALRLAGSFIPGDDDEEQRSGFSPRQRKVASTHLLMPDSPTLPTVGPQVRMRRSEVDILLSESMVSEDRALPFEEMGAALGRKSAIGWKAATVLPDSSCTYVGYGECPVSGGGRNSKKPESNVNEPFTMGSERGPRENGNRLRKQTQPHHASCKVNRYCGAATRGNHALAPLSLRPITALGGEGELKLE